MPLMAGFSLACIDRSIPVSQFNQFIGAYQPCNMFKQCPACFLALLTRLIFSTYFRLQVPVTSADLPSGQEPTEVRYSE